MMKRSYLALIFALVTFVASAQPAPKKEIFKEIYAVPHTPVKNQANTGTCWSFSTTSLLESQSIKSGTGDIDLSEMFTVRNIYIEKARNYMLRQGAAQFGPGGLGHDVINAIDKYGAVPEQVYSGLLLGVKYHDHSKLDAKLKSYLDSLLKSRPVPSNWMQPYEAILDEHLGKAPQTFTFREKVYTPKTFADEVLKFRREDYVFLTSFTHHPFYKSFVLEIPDNYSNESYYNVPLDELIKITNDALSRGYSVMWDADVSNANFRQKEGYALNLKDSKKTSSIDPDAEEAAFDQQLRQQLFESLVTQDDHLMHIVGLEQTAAGKKLYVVKNSWGEVGPFKGLIKVSEGYFAMNTITLVVPRAALNEGLKSKLANR